MTNANNRVIDVSVDVVQVLEHFVASVPGARDLPGVFHVLFALKAGKYKEALGFTRDPFEFVGSPNKLVLYRQFLALFKKVSFSGEDAKSRAIATWRSNETALRRTNQIWKARMRFPVAAQRRSPVMESLLNRSRHLIEGWLGRLTTGKYQRILSLSRPGPGICIGTRDRLLTAPVAKYLDTDHHCTRGALPLVRDWFLQNPKLLSTLRSVDGRLGVDVSASNRVTFVPKNAQTHRSIAIEPGLNVMLQLGVHEYLTRVFSQKGIAHLQDQRVNQFLAGLGTRSPGLNSLSTIDLSNASDSVSIGLVQRLVPDDWYHLLSSLRCTHSTLEGEVVKLEKFSSMGNGFTFALETLIFKALAESVREYAGGSITSVYGDDIIIDTKCSLLLIDLFDYCGLTVNTDKSFVVGPFKESCGADWLSGTLITPIYLKTRKVDIRSLHRLWNGLKGGLFSEFRKWILSTVRSTGTPLFGPPCAPAEACFKLSRSQMKTVSTARWCKHLQTWKYQAVITDGVDFSREHELAYASALLSGAFSLAKRGVSRRRVGWKLAV